MCWNWVYLEAIACFYKYFQFVSYHLHVWASQLQIEPPHMLHMLPLPLCSFSWCLLLTFSDPWLFLSSFSFTFFYDIILPFCFLIFLLTHHLFLLSLSLATNISVFLDTYNTYVTNNKDDSSLTKNLFLVKWFQGLLVFQNFRFLQYL